MSRSSILVEREDKFIYQVQGHGFRGALLSYMYGNLTFDVMENNVYSLVRASEKYDIPDLKEDYENRLLEHISDTNIVWRLKVAWDVDFNHLQQELAIFIEEVNKADDDHALSLMEELIMGSEPLTQGANGRGFNCHYRFFFFILYGSSSWFQPFND